MLLPLTDSMMSLHMSLPCVATVAFTAAAPKQQDRGESYDLTSSDAYAERKRRLEKKAAAASSHKHGLATHNGVRGQVVCR